MLDEDDNDEIESEDSFENDSPLSYSERKEVDLKKMDAKRRLEEYLENKRLEKEWADY